MVDKYLETSSIIWHYAEPYNNKWFVICWSRNIHHPLTLCRDGGLTSYTSGCLCVAGVKWRILNTSDLFCLSCDEFMSYLAITLAVNFHILRLYSMCNTHNTWKPVVHAHECGGCYCCSCVRAFGTCCTFVAWWYSNIPYFMTFHICSPNFCCPHTLHCVSHVIWIHGSSMPSKTTQSTSWNATWTSLPCCQPHSHVILMNTSAGQNRPCNYEPSNMRIFAAAAWNSQHCRHFKHPAISPWVFSHIGSPFHDMFKSTNPLVWTIAGKICHWPL